MLNALAPNSRVEPTIGSRVRADGLSVIAADAKYLVKLAGSANEVAGALRLRNEVFNIELKGGSAAADTGLEYDEFDLRCRHLIAIERATGQIVGTYRLNSLGAGESLEKLYSYSEFAIEGLSDEVVRNGIEVGRACVAREHRGSKALFLLWKGLARHLSDTRRRYVFGCCSLFTREPSVAACAYRKLATAGNICNQNWITPRRNGIDVDIDVAADDVTLPMLFELYLRMGARVCSPPMYDAEFGTMDFFVILDICQIPPRYQKMFFAHVQT